ncbi:hypothetical protein [Methylorubrum populi]
MLSIPQTSILELNTAQEIAEHLKATFDQMMVEGDFANGEVVDIVDRASLHPDIGIGEVAVMLCDMPRQPWSWIVVYARGGQPMAIQVPTNILAKRHAASEGEGQ